jgi:hypothetical protein
MGHRRRITFARTNIIVSLRRIDSIDASYCTRLMRSEPVIFLRAFFQGMRCNRVMSNREVEVMREVKRAVRLRTPERNQMEMVCSCADDLIAKDHPVRTVAAVVEKLDQLFTQVIASWVDQGLVKVKRVSQDGVRVRASAGASSFRREERLTQLLDQARRHIEELRRQMDDRGHAAAVGSGRQAARERAAREKVERLERAVAQLPELKRKQQEAARQAGNGKRGQQIRAREPRVSTTDPETRVMKMPNGGFNPAVNVQLATDTQSRAIVAVDGGYLRTRDLERAHEQGVELFIPPKRAKNPQGSGRELQDKPGDSPALRDWRRRMRSDEGKEIYKQRASTSETVNADLRGFRGLVQLTVRGLAKSRCVALWCALGYNLMHFGSALIK